ncbi:Ent-kaurene synthase [Clathrospora elynae]|uniref:Ent-kaurene synthase n=1 Tax=Clathrospora elynae TaxID=706981 RepID=A0A6A5SQL5_9PLEO|nr:Ent-kaurene synthase [Clathrospora elynae]
MSSAMDAIGPGNGLPCPKPNDFIEHVAQAYENLSRFSTFSATVYDTAWLSMIYKPYKPDVEPSLLFPGSFDYIVENQKNDGSWEAYGTSFDAIINSLAAILTMVVHSKKKPKASCNIRLDRRIANAKLGVQILLNEWKVEDTVHVGFEVLVIGLLRQLEDHGLRFTFPALPDLRDIYNQKMSKFSPKMIYARSQTTILHSLEALCGEVNFDELSHHCTETTGILGSPAATAAYLINASEWDLQAVKYLESVVEAYGGSGKVPSAFPTSTFELSWALSSLLPSMANREILSPAVLDKFSVFFGEIMKVQDGLVGFSPGILPDADDTARVLMTLKCLGKPMEPTPMIRHFENESHFKTYHLERNPSFSANCNVLLALLQAEDVDQYLTQVEKTSAFLLQEWEAGGVTDKWNIAPQYPALLLSEALITILKRYAAAELQGLPADTVLKRIPLVICQILLQILQDQQDDGSWNGSLEQTSYSVRTLAHCLCLPWNSILQATLMRSFTTGRSFIAMNYPQLESNHYLWVEKTTYQSAMLKTAYCSLAVHTPAEEHTWTEVISDIFYASEKKSKQLGGLLASLPIFAHSPFVSIDLVVLEASISGLYLKDSRHSIMERDLIPMSKDKYLEIIPLIWVTCNHVSSHVLPPNVIRDMCVISMLIYQIDELMESVVAEFPISQIDYLEGMLQDEGNGDGPRKRRKISMKGVKNGHHNGDSNGYVSALGPVVEAIRKFIAQVCQHPAVVRSPLCVQKSLALEVHRFLLGHIAHIKDNCSLRPSKSYGQQANGNTPDHSPPRDYYKWVHSTGSDDTSCPFAFQYFACLISAAESYCFQGPQALYYGQALAFHLSAMCRQYNDFGSATRDRAEGNLNSMDFEEFRERTEDDGQVDEDMKENLIKIAEFERASMELALGKLGSVVDDAEVMRKLQVYVDVTDTFGQIYVVKDFSSQRTK